MIARRSTTAWVDSRRLVGVGLAVIQVLDTVTTLWGRNRGVEANPLMAEVLARLGAGGFVAVKVLGTVTVMVLISDLPRRQGRVIGLTAICVSAVAVIVNLVTLGSL